MCLVFAAWKVIPHCPLVIVFNRDESYDRPTQALHLWKDAPHPVGGGRDLLKGGSWAGVTQDGRGAFLTFKRMGGRATDPQKSRGVIVADFLRSAFTPEGYLRYIRAMKDEFLPFNLLLTDGRDRLIYYSSHLDQVEEIQPGIHGLSNAEFNTPWPKVTKGVDLLKSFQSEDFAHTEKLFTLMQDQELAEDVELPSTGVPAEREKALSAICVREVDYGTISTSIVRWFDSPLVTHEIIERQYEISSNEKISENALQFPRVF